MTTDATNPEVGASGSGKICSSLGGSNNTPDHKPSTTDKQAVIAALAALNREYEAESARLQIIASARGAAAKFTHVADNFALGDFEDGRRAFEAARQYGAAVASHIKKMEASLDAEGNAIIAEAFQL